MKVLLASLVLLCAVGITASLALAADTAAVGGNWQVHVTIGNYDNTFTCAFTQKDAALTGNCTSDAGPEQLTGNVDGNKITWTYKTDYNGQSITVAYAGTFDPATSKITGTVNVPDLSADGEFTATQPQTAK
jgi:hypothetical protein